MLWLEIISYKIERDIASGVASYIYYLEISKVVSSVIQKVAIYTNLYVYVSVVAIVA